MTQFKTIRARAERRKGSAVELVKLLSPKTDYAALAALSDDRILADWRRRLNR